MSSFVFYKFKSQKEASRISFDGTSISVWDLKKEIIQENKMGKGADFDFAIYNADTEEGLLILYYCSIQSLIPYNRIYRRLRFNSKIYFSFSSSITTFKTK